MWALGDVWGENSLMAAEKCEHLRETVTFMLLFMSLVKGQLKEMLQ